MTFFKLDLYNSVVHSDNWDHVFPCPNGKVTRPRRSDGPSFLPCNGCTNKSYITLLYYAEKKHHTNSFHHLAKPRNLTNMNHYQGYYKSIILLIFFCCCFASVILFPHPFAWSKLFFLSIDSRKLGCKGSWKLVKPDQRTCHSIQGTPEKTS